MCLHMPIAPPPPPGRCSNTQKENDFHMHFTMYIYICMYELLSHISIENRYKYKYFKMSPGLKVNSLGPGDILKNPYSYLIFFTDMGW